MEEISCLALESLVFFLSFVSTEIRIRKTFLGVNSYLLVLISVCALFLIVMTVIRFLNYMFFLKAKNVEKKFTNVGESQLLPQIIWTVLFCFLTPNIFFESEYYTIELFDEETSKLSPFNTN